jgi:hypothetical protein
MRQAIVDNGVVVNIAVGDAGGIEIPDDSPVSIGWTHSAGVFAAPVPLPPTVNQQKDALQAKIDTIEAGQRTAIREAILNKAGAMGKLTAIDSKVVALRAQKDAL